MDIKFEDNSEEVLAALHHAVPRALRIIGGKIERYAKKLCPVGTPESTGKPGYRGGTLRNSITFEVDAAGRAVYAGTNVVYAPYVELGTGPNFTPPPEWEDFDVPTPSGIGKGYVKARPFLAPAVKDHAKEYRKILRNELEKG